MNSTACILNAVIDALNTEDRLPRFLVLPVDMGVLRDFKNSDHILDKHINAVVNFVTRQVEILVRRKKSQIMEKRPGALAAQTDPTVIYIDMIQQQ